VSGGVLLIRHPAAGIEIEFAMRKQAIAGWAISLAGTALWLYGYYYTTGHAAFVDWQIHTPWWIADFLPNSEAEIGMALICVGSAVTYWPPRV